MPRFYINKTEMGNYRLGPDKETAESVNGLFISDDAGDILFARLEMKCKETTQVDIRKVPVKK